MELVALDDGARLATWTSGAADQVPPVVLLHGGPGLWDYLEPLAGMIDDLTLVHRYDQRGCGRSDRRGPLSMARYVEDLDCLRRHWGYDRWTLIGHSFGATLALAYAGTYPDRAATVGYLSGVGIGDWRTPFHVEQRRRAHPYEARLEQLATTTPRIRDEEIEFRVMTWATDYADTARGLELARPMAEAEWDINYQANRDVSFTEIDCLSWASRTSCCVTFIHGSEDPRPAANAMLLAAAIPGSRQNVIQGAGHLPWQESPEQVAAITRSITVAAA